MEETKKTEHCIMVSKLSRTVSSAHLEEIFGSFGPLKAIELDVDRRNGMSKGIAKVCFLNRNDAETAMIYMDGGQIDGLVVSVADKISTIPLDKKKSFSTKKEKIDGDVDGKVDKVNSNAEFKRKVSNTVPLTNRSERVSNINVNNTKYIPKDRSQIGDTGRNRSRSQTIRRDREISHVINESTRYLRRDNRNVDEFRCTRSRDRFNSRKDSNISSHYGPLSTPSRRAGGWIDNGIYGPAGAPSMRRGYIPVVRDGRDSRRSRSRERGNRGQLSTRTRDSHDRNVVHRRTHSGSPIRSHSRGRTRSVSRSRSRRYRRSSSRSSRSRSSSRSASNRRRRRYSPSSSDSSVSARNTRRYSSSRSRSRRSSSSRSLHRYSPSRSRSDSRSTT